MTALGWSLDSPWMVAPWDSHTSINESMTKGIDFEINRYTVFYDTNGWL